MDKRPPYYGSNPRLDERKYSWRGRIVFLSNIPYVYKAQDVMIIMKIFGRVFRVDLARSDNGKSKGFAFIEFEKQEDARTAVDQMDTAQLLNKRLRCEISERPPPELIDMYVLFYSIIILLPISSN